MPHILLGQGSAPVDCKLVEICYLTFIPAFVCYLVCGLLSDRFSWPFVIDYNRLRGKAWSRVPRGPFRGANRFWFRSVSIRGRLRVYQASTRQFHSTRLACDSRAFAIDSGEMRSFATCGLNLSWFR